MAHKKKKWNEVDLFRSLTKLYNDAFEQVKNIPVDAKQCVGHNFLILIREGVELFREGYDESNLEKKVTIIENAYKKIKTSEVDLSLMVGSRCISKEKGGPILSYDIGDCLSQFQLLLNSMQQQPMAEG